MITVHSKLKVLKINKKLKKDNTYSYSAVFLTDSFDKVYVNAKKDIYPKLEALLASDYEQKPVDTEFLIFENRDKSTNFDKVYVLILSDIN